MDELLLKRDQELSEINAELELKTSILMQEMENVMKLHDVNDDGTSFENELFDDNNALDSALIETGNPKKTMDERFTTAASWRGKNSEPELRFLKAKLKILTTELESQQAEHHRKVAEWRAREGEVKSMREERDRSVQHAGVLAQQVAKLTASVSERTERVQRLEADNTKLANEVQASKREAKAATQRASTLELRMNRVQEEGESLRAALNNERMQDKEEREEQRRTMEQHTAWVQRAERQRNELALAFRRQMMLCNSLQRQKELLVAGAALQAAEGQFDQLLSSKHTKPTPM